MRAFTLLVLTAAAAVVFAAPVGAQSLDGAYRAAMSAK